VKLINRAMLCYPGLRVHSLGLFQVGEAVFRWVVESSGREFTGRDYLDKPSAIVGLRVFIEGNPAFEGVNVTIHSVEPSPQERAAKRILQKYSLFEKDLSLDEVCEIIRQETAIDRLRDSGEILLAHLLTHGWVRDLALGGLMLSFLDALERSGGVKYDALRKTLTELPEMFTPASQIPGGTIQ
jgi:hypothetical protein